MEFDTQPILDLAPHCQYWAGEHHPHCPNRVEARVEPKPVGQFAPADVCAIHTLDWVNDHAFHLGDDWSITPVDDEARGRIQEEFDSDWQDVNPGIDPDLLVPCETCGHDRLDHAFYPVADGYYGEPAPFCRVEVDAERCDCDGYIMYPVSAPWSASH